jgi:molybdopterin-guanine dinucleotide biosynthesis protein A
MTYMGGTAIKSTQSALVLAGGRSLRMGYDKKELVINGQKVFDRLLAQLSFMFDQVLVSSNQEIAGVETLPDELGSGPMAGIYRGLSRSLSDYLYVIACDMPFINRDYIDYMRRIVEETDCDVCLTARGEGRYEPFNAFYSVRCLEPIKEALVRQNYKVRQVLDTLKLHVIDTKTAESFNSAAMFLNINNPKDLEMVEKQLSYL